MFQTRITALFGIKYPIQVGCMMNVSTAEFVAAACNAGVLGTLCSAMCPTTESFRAEIRKVKDLTDQPFAVNVNLFPTVRPVKTEEYIDIIHEEGVPIIETSGRGPRPYLERIRRGKILFLHKCARPKDVASLAAMGADAAGIIGVECGGHPGLDDVGTMVVAPLAADAASIPLLVGGGIADGRGLLAALALGADGAVIGTRFMATKEAPLHDNVKEWFVKASENDTMVVQRSIGSNNRVIKNAAAVKTLELESRGATLQELLPVIGNENRLRALRDGDVEAGTMSCGQAVGLIKDVPSVQEVVETIMAQAETARRRILG